MPPSQGAGEKAHRLRHRLVEVGDTLDETFGRFSPDSASPRRSSSAVGEEQDPITLFGWSLGDHRCGPSIADGQGRRAFQLTHDAVVSREQRGWVVRVAGCGV